MVLILKVRNYCTWCNKQNSILNKDSKVLFVGRIVKEKGVEIYVDAIKKIANNFPNWQFFLIGNSGTRNKFFKNKFENEIIEKFKNIGPNTNQIGFISNPEVLKIMEKSSILVVPSLWQEPFGLTAIEGLANRMIVRGNNVGGLKDIIKDRGILIDNINAEKLSLKLNELMKNPSLMNKFQNKCWENYIFDQKKVSNQQDKIRENIYKSFYND